MVSKVHIIPSSDHNMHIDNPDALACQIINDIYDAKLPILRNIYSDEHKAKLLQDNNSDP